MAVKHRITHRQRSNRLTREVLELQLRMATVMASLLAADSDPTRILTRSQRLRLADVTRKCGLDREKVVRRAVGTWLAVEAPVYKAHYDA